MKFPFNMLASTVFTFVIVASRASFVVASPFITTLVSVSLAAALAFSSIVFLAVAVFALSKFDAMSMFSMSSTTNLPVRPAVVPFGFNTKFTLSAVPVSASLIPTTRSFPRSIVSTVIVESFRSF